VRGGAARVRDNGGMSQTEPSADPAGEETAGVQEATVRRAPRFAAFIVVGALVGFIVTAAVTMQFPADPAVGMIALVAYFSLFGVSAGAALGALLALILDRRSRRRERRVRVEHAVVAPEDAAPAP